MDRMDSRALNSETANSPENTHHCVEDESTCRRTRLYSKDFSYSCSDDASYVSYIENQEMNFTQSHLMQS